MLKIEVDPGGKAAAQLHGVAQQLQDARPLFRSIAGMLEAQTEANFAAQGRPSWVPLAASTRAERLKRNRGGSVLKILQDRGILASSVSSSYGEDFAQVGAGGAAKDYAAIHQFGGTIERAAHSVKTRLRTDAKGNLVRQEAHKNLAVFARDGHKRARESWHEVEAYQVQIPARPYLPFSGPPDNAVLQPEAEASLLDLLQRYVIGAAGR
ncbi:MAG: phage virion morphogenesis protein [Burkholderiaceae bacterium]|nr:phage virion morphogenesis protein [Burkholderiaceae bacterium]